MRYMDISTLQYQVTFTNTGLRAKTVNVDTFGSGTDLTFTVKDENGTAIDLSALTTNMKIYVGTHSALKISGGTLLDVDVANGKVKYPLTDANFTESDVGTYDIELQFANDAVLATATKIIRAGGATLSVVDTING